METKLVTVFTPTYNRASTLSKCYKSLLSQKSKNFIWLIIDDGSIDNTKDLVLSWMESSPFIIKYYQVENGGKARAINKSLELTTTKLWLCLDSDDFLVEDAIEIIEHQYQSIEKNDSICGLFSLRGKSSVSSMQGIEIPKNISEVTQSFVRYELKIPPEYLHVFKTEIISQYKYPSIEGENYFPLSFVFDQIDQIYSYKVIHKPLMVCEYREDGLTKNKRDVVKKNPVGYMLYKKQLISLAPTKKEKAKAVATFVTGCLLAKKNPFKDNQAKILTFLMFPIGCLDYLFRYKLGVDLGFEINIKKNDKDK